MARLIKGEESETHLRAFEIYYGLGNSRNLNGVAREMGLSESAIKGWSRTFNWAARIEERDAQVAQEINKKAVKLAATRKMQYLDTINLGMEKFEEGLKNGSIRVASVADAERLVNMYTKLIGESQVNQTNIMIVTAADIIKAEKQVSMNGRGFIDLDLSDYTVSEPTEAQDDNRRDN